MAKTTKNSPKTAPGGLRPAGSLLVRDLDQLKALSDPLRVRILQGFAEGARTVKELAATLGARQSRLYHHVAILETTGLIQVAETRPVRGTIEKRYRAAASRFEIDGSMFSSGAPDLDTGKVEMVSSLLAQARAELLDCQREAGAGAAGAPRPFLARMVFKGTPETTAALVGRIQALLAECCGGESQGEEAGDRRDYALTIAMSALSPGGSHGLTQAEAASQGPARTRGSDHRD